MSPTVRSAHADPMPLSIAWLQLQLDCAVVAVAQVLTLQTQRSRRLRCHVADAGVAEFRRGRCHICCGFCSALLDGSCRRRPCRRCCSRRGVNVTAAVSVIGLRCCYCCSASCCWSCAVIVVAVAAGAAPSYQLSLLLKSPWLMMSAANTRLRSLSS